jgi:hypothetical protein
MWRLFYVVSALVLADGILFLQSDNFQQVLATLYDVLLSSVGTSLSPSYENFKIDGI